MDSLIFGGDGLHYIYDADTRMRHHTVVTAVVVPGSANVADCATTGPRSGETMIYPDGTSDHAVRTDMRGVRTVTRNFSFPDRDEHISQTFHPTNLTTHILLASNVTWRNGRSVSLQSWHGGWTRETSLTDYAADGCRHDVAISEASDLPGVITNRLTHCDILGRTVATFTPGAAGAWLVTSNTYDCATSRLICSETTGRPAITYLYDELGEMVGTVQSSITSASDTRYETVSNEVWRVTTQSTSASGVTNAVTTTRQQLTGLSNALRSRTVATAAHGAVYSEAHAFDPETRELTVTWSTDDATPAVSVSKFGRTVSRRTLSEAVRNYFDPFGRVYYFVANHPVTDASLYDRWSEFDESDNEVYHDAYYGDLFVTGSKAFDAFSRETSHTDAYGNTVTTAYDALGRPVAADGATFPTLTAYDTAGRAISLDTTRNGNSWDTTRWGYDALTGRNTSKTYADDTVVTYTHTPDGKPVRTIWARGEWREYAYDGRGQPATVTYSDTTPASFHTYDAFGYPSASSNTVAQYAYANSALGAATNEVAVIGANAFTLTRQLDGHHRLAALSVDGQLHAAYTYDAENRLSVVSNTAFIMAYAYTTDGFDAGGTITVANGTVITRTLTRDNHRRDLVTLIANRINGTPDTPLSYTHDSLDRVTSRNSDVFGYNSRSEVISANIQSTSSRYAYDDIGNNLWTSIHLTTNTYTANALNQYAAINATSLAHDDDGNLLVNGVWSYTWDGESRLTAVYSNSVCVVSNAYDHHSRRVLKITSSTTHAYVYDGWNLIQEKIHNPQSTITNRYVWGKDLSGTLQGSGGVGGLIAVSLDGVFYYPCYDNNGNVMAYAAESGTIVAQYTYDAFGRTMASSGPMANAFSYRFSTKYFDPETGLYYYGYRFYMPDLMRWANRDSIEEIGGLNLYAFIYNNPVGWFDIIGLRQGSSSPVQPASKATPGSCGVCGPDITDNLKAALTKLRAIFEGWTPEQRLRALRFISKDNDPHYAVTLPDGTADIPPAWENGWDILDLSDKTGPSLDWLFQAPYNGCASGDSCQKTVQVDKKCFYAGSVNYVVFGRMIKLLSEEFPKGHATQVLKPSRLTLNLLISLYKGKLRQTLMNAHTVINDLPKENVMAPNYQQSHDWATAGFDGWPNGIATPQPSATYQGCVTSCPTKCTRMFRVYWFPNGEF